MEHHRSAINHDLITRTPYTIDDVGVRLSWTDLHDFLKYLPPESAYFREVNGQDVSDWMAGRCNAAILADLYDMLNRWRHDAAGSRRHVDAYRRPHVPGPDDERIGGEGLAPDDFDVWWESMTKKEG